VSQPLPSGPYTVVLGLGRSGLGAARLLQRRGDTVLVLESGTGTALEQRAENLRASGIAVQLATPLSSESFEALPMPPQRVIVSPGIRWDHPALEELRRRGIRTDGEISTAWEATQPVPWIGITGTNGIDHRHPPGGSPAGRGRPGCADVRQCGPFRRRSWPWPGWRPSRGYPSGWWWS